MYKSIFAVLAAAATLTSAVPTTRSPRSDDNTCMSPETAAYLVNGFASLLTDPANVATNAPIYLAPGFTDNSDSINFLAGIPLGSPTFPSLGAFIAGQGSEPPIGFQVLSIDAVTCNTIAFRWLATVGPQPVRGINIMYTTNPDCSEDGWQIETNYSEFNSAVWDIDVGGSCSPPPQ